MIGRSHISTGPDARGPFGEIISPQKGRLRDVSDYAPCLGWLSSTESARGGSRAGWPEGRSSYVPPPNPPASEIDPQTTDATQGPGTFPRTKRGIVSLTVVPHCRIRVWWFVWERSSAGVRV
eukprot:1185326-Prorocentrum_minimum.AAC.3